MFAEMFWGAPFLPALAKTAANFRFFHYVANKLRFGALSGIIWAIIGEPPFQTVPIFSSSAMRLMSRMCCRCPESSRQ